jgi:hypothetical protein
LKPGLEHELQDDLESFFWVLLWVSLRYTRHNLPPEDLNDLLSAFDQVFWESNRGGTRKRNILLARQIPNDVKFKNGALDKLFDRFNDLFAVRYKEPPSPPELDAYHILKAAFAPDHPVIRTNRVQLYTQHMDHLRTSLFMLDTLRNATQNRTSWPRDDKATRQVFGSTLVTDKKRKSDQDKIDSCRVSQSKKFKANNGCIREEDSDNNDGDDQPPL